MIWKDVMPEVNLALKITDWCNLSCKHCCERCGPKNPYNLMPVTDIEKYVDQFASFNVMVWNMVVITGGETLAPYYMQQGEYIPKVLDILNQYDLCGALKTNAMWGDNLFLRKRILTDLDNIAHKYDRQVALDISVDEYHDNLIPASKIVLDVMDSCSLIDSVPISLVGLNTTASRNVRDKFLNILEQNGVRSTPPTADGVIYMHKNEKQNVMFWDESGLTRLGRAKDNNLTTAEPSGRPTQTGNCLMITNDSQAILNYKYKTTVGNKTLGQIYNKLLQRIR